MTENEQKPTCESCGRELQCDGCDDTRPTAEDLGPGWRVLSPFGRWEDVERVAQENRYAPVQVWTKQAGPDFSWIYGRWEKIEARRPAWLTNRGEPEIRVLVSKDDVRMYVAATTGDTRYGWSAPGSSAILAEAGNAGRGKGWWVWVSPTMGILTPPADEGLTKDKARSELKRHAREFGKLLKVKVRIVE